MGLAGWLPTRLYSDWTIFLKCNENAVVLKNQGGHFPRERRRRKGSRQCQAGDCPVSGISCQVAVHLSPCSQLKMILCLSSHEVSCAYGEAFGVQMFCCQKTVRYLMNSALANRILNSLLPGLHCLRASLAASNLSCRLPLHASPSSFLRFIFQRRSSP